ncbi:MAG: DUF998 domain-containing protein [Pseudoxanthomonas sp.]|nr:DUF998 domain-containing protein [Pseudoxanthomonas sp.]
MDRTLLARMLLIAAMVMCLALLVGGAALKPGYTHSASLISELNATGTPWASAIGWFGFLPVGLLLTAFLFTAAPRVNVRGASRLGYWLLLSQPIAYIGAVLVPCDAGCPLEGSLSQALHNLLGVLTYPAGGIGIVLLATAPGLTPANRIALAFAGGLWLGLFLLMVIPELAPWRGVFQRIAEVILYAVLVFTAWRMMPRK